MKELLKLLMKRAPWSVALVLFAILGYLIYTDVAARHALLMALSTAGGDMDWPLTALIGVLAWTGNRVHLNLDELNAQVAGLHQTMLDFDRDLREAIQGTKDLSMTQFHNLSERMAIVEERCDKFDKHRADTCPHNKPAAP